MVRERDVSFQRGGKGRRGDAIGAEIPCELSVASIVYQATPRDPLVLTGVVLAMALLGLLATWIPARRALSIDPMVLLREE